MTTKTEVGSYRPDELLPFHLNPRIGNVDVIANSLQANSQYRPVIVNKGTHTGRPMEILKGNHTVLAFQDLQEKYPDDERWAKVYCWIIDVDDDRAARIVAGDNRIADMGTFDDKILLDLLKELPDINEGTGYSSEDLAAMEEALREYQQEQQEGDSSPSTEPTEQDGWPVVKTRVAPTVYALFEQVPGEDHADKIQTLLSMAQPPTDEDD